MTDCGVCGNRQAIGNAVVEGARVAVCQRCANYGRKLELFEEYLPPRREYAPRQSKRELVLSDDYAIIIQKARRGKGLSRDEFAKKVAMHESEIKSFEEGRVKPSPEKAKKLEYELGVTLLVPEAEDNSPRASVIKSGEAEEPTLADFIKKKK